MIRRFLQVCKYGWRQSTDIPHARVLVFFDMLYCFITYKMWSNDYIKEEFWKLSKEERISKGADYRQKGIARDIWQRDFQSNRDFIIKYSDIKYEKSSLRGKRTRAYIKHFKTGLGLNVEYDVNISRQHYLNGTISIGKNVLLAKHVFIDYSGFVTIKDNVQLTNGVIIETHHHPFHSDWRQPRNLVLQTSLVIEEGAVIGSRAIIMPSCHYIGKHARVGAGSIVTHDVPDFSVVVGCPAREIRINV